MSSQGSSDRYCLVESLYQRAVDLPTDRRGEFLSAQCAGDHGLRAEVEALLDHYNAASENFLESPALVFPTSFDLEEIMPEQIGSYRIIRLLGRGGMGEVYEAEQSQPRRRVAIKMIRGDRLIGVGARRFRLEADMLGRLRHPGIAQIYEFDVGEVWFNNTPAHRQPFFAMELVEGMPLGQHVTNRQLKQTDVLELLARICDAVHYAHQKGVIHRDLKPANILVVDESRSVDDQNRVVDNQSRDREGAVTPEIERALALQADAPTTIKSFAAQPKILDFGVARATGADVQTQSLQTGVGQLIGTIPYMSPEQLSGDPLAVDTRTDVYALGVVAFEILTGRLPHDIDGLSAPQAIRIRSERDAHRAGSVRPELRGDLDAILAKALERNPDRRYPSAAELAADLRRYVRHEPVTARPSTALYHLAKFVRRNRTLVATAAAVALILVGATIWTTRAMFQARRATDRAVAINEFMEDILSSADPVSGRADVKLVEVLRQAADEAATRFGNQPEQEVRVRLMLGSAFHNLSLFDEALVHQSRAHEILRTLRGAADRETLKAAQLHAWLLYRVRRLDDAMREAREALALIPPDQTDGEIALALRRTIASVYLMRSDFDTAEMEYRSVLSAARRSFGDRYSATLHGVVGLAELLSKRAMRTQGDSRKDNLECFVLLRDNMPNFEFVYGENGLQTLHVMVTLSECARRLNEFEVGAQYAERALDLAPPRFGESHELCARAHSAMCHIRYEQRRYAEASEHLVRSVQAMRNRNNGKDSADTLAKMSDGLPVLDAAGRLDVGEEYSRILWERFSTVAGHAAALPFRYRAHLARFLSRQGKLEEAAGHFDEILAVEADQPDQKARVRLDLGYGAHLTALGRFDEAERRLMSARERLAPGDWMLMPVYQELERLYTAWGKAEEAAVWHARLEQPYHAVASRADDASPKGEP